MKMRSSTFTSWGNLNEDQTGFFNFCQVNFANEWKRCTNVRLHRVIASVQNSIPINYKATNILQIKSKLCVLVPLSYFCMKWNIFFPLYMRWWMKHSVPHKQQNLPCRICCTYLSVQPNALSTMLLCVSLLIKFMQHQGNLITYPTNNYCKIKPAIL